MFFNQSHPDQDLRNRDLDDQDRIDPNFSPPVLDKRHFDQMLMNQSNESLKKVLSELENVECTPNNMVSYMEREEDTRIQEGLTHSKERYPTNTKRVRPHSAVINIKSRQNASKQRPSQQSKR